ncbi:MAG TPA: PHP domain-containing protein [Candidatus Eisenbacteria bacterium]|nr:PHP domain-containing protein [Candidatus Eisenbacteria bacterium]
MSASRLDLHLHSTASDGADTPVEVAAHAAREGVEIIALTDHDAVDGIPPLRERAEAAGIRVITGAELSINEQGIDVHVLAYGFDPEEPGFQAALARWREGRHERARKILARLKGVGIRISIEDVEAIADGGAIGRPHVAEALMREGFVETLNEAFQRFLGHHAPAYVPKMKVTMEEATTIVRDAGGVTALAHPGTLNRDHLIAGWTTRGLDGIEVWHTKHDASSVKRYSAIASQYGLLRTGGSDCHGERTPGVKIGSVPVPDSILAPLEEAIRSRRPIRARP